MCYEREVNGEIQTGAKTSPRRWMAFGLCMKDSRFRPLREKRMEPSDQKEHMGRRIHYRAKEINHLENKRAG